LQEISKKKDELFIQNLHKIKLIDGIENTLQEIKQKGHQLALVTNCNRDASNKILEITNLAKYFDTVMMLDQESDSYPHFKSLVTTIRLMYDLESSGVNTIYKDNVSSKNLLYWRKFLKENKSFCFYPFAALINDNEFAHICEKNHLPITKINNIQEWTTDTEFTNIRNKMVAGTLIPKYCADCYNREERGQESMRQFETLEWASRIGAKSVDDFINIDYYMYISILLFIM
jgi:hypothetical protein